MRKMIVATLGAWMVLLAGCSSDDASAPPGDDDDTTDAGGTTGDAASHADATAPGDASSGSDATTGTGDAASGSDAATDATGASDSAPTGDDETTPPDASDDASEPDAVPDAAGDAGTDAAPPPPPPPATYTVGGQVSGLTGTVILENEKGDPLTVTANGTFTFATKITSGQPYAVTVSQQPALPANDSCAVTAASGTVADAPVTSVVVTCTIAPPDTITGVDVVDKIDTTSGRTPISPLIYGINGEAGDSYPAALMKGVTFVRRGGDRGNSYNWETNVSNGGIENGYASDLSLTAGVANPNEPAGQDLTALRNNRAAGRATMVPFVLNDYVAKQVVDYIPWDQPGFVRTDYFTKETILKPTPYASTPSLTDGVVYTDEQLAYMRAQFPDDILAPSATRLIVGIDNECDLWDYNFPMLQTGQGAGIPANANGASNSSIIVGTQVTANEFFQRVISFTSKVKSLAPQSYIVGPSHYGFDGFRAWNLPSSPMYPSTGHWFMDDFLAAMNTASAKAGIRLLDVWDFHWYPQQVFDGVTVSALDNNQGALSAAEITAIVQGPRSYWDPTYNENSWITDQYHLDAPAYILTRLQQRIAAGYPGTPIGVSEYFPGGLNHVSSGLATADTLGVFGRMGVELAAMWPNGSNSDCAFAFGGIELLRNADGNGMAYAGTSVSVVHPELSQSSVYAGMDTPNRVTVLVVNKTTATRTFGLELTNADRLGKVAIYTLDAAHSTPYLAKSDTLTKSNAYAFSAGAMSASMLVFTTP
jgi:hypothetical protein